MAKAENNIVLRGVRGKLGDLVVRQMRDGSIRLSARPDFSSRVFSQGQKDHQRRFKQAAAYARQAARTQPIYAELAGRMARNAYNIALSDWFNPPVIHSIRRTGAAIGVEASDDVLVAKVRVQILDERGQVLEEGEASRGDPELRPEWWEYRPNAEGRTIIAEAWDLAGNRSELIA
ncbi:MAG TPA: hypothetical protein VI524_08530 [Anaerolineales bacterium]|nr:hypothetical protein [Anaerolineales bacterium]